MVFYPGIAQTFSDACNGFSSTWEDVTLLGIEETFPLSPGGVVTVTCKPQGPGRVVLIRGDAVLTCITQQNYEFEEEPNCSTLGRIDILYSLLLWIKLLLISGTTQDELKTLKPKNTSSKNKPLNTQQIKLQISEQFINIT